MMKPSRDFKYPRQLLIILSVGLISLLAFRQDISKFLTIVGKYPALSIVISLSLYALLGATPVPSEPLTLLLITLYRPIVTVLIVTIGNTLAALLEFFIGGNIGDLAEFEKRKAKLPFHLGEIPLQSPLFLLLARMLPGFGPKFVSMACGIYKVRLSTYTWTTLISNLIGAVMVVAGGYGLLKLL